MQRQNRYFDFEEPAQKRKPPSAQLGRPMQAENRTRVGVLGPLERLERSSSASMRAWGGLVSQYVARVVLVTMVVSGNDS